MFRENIRYSSDLLYSENKIFDIRKYQQYKINDDAVDSYCMYITLNVEEY